MQTVRPRFEGIDIAKGIGIIAVILGHTYFIHGWDIFHRLVYPWHMPLFFVLAGCFLSTKSSLRKFVIDKSHRLLVPYFTFGLLGIVGLSVVRSMLLSEAPFLQELCLGMRALMYGSTRSLSCSLVGPVRPIGALWFLPALFVALVIARIALSVRFGVVASLILSSAVLVYRWFEGIWLPLSVEVGLFAAIYLLFGKFMMAKTHLVTNPSLRLGLLGFVVYIACVVYNQRVGLGTLTFSHPLMLIAPFAIVYCVVVVSECLAKVTYASTALKFVGRHSMAVYCTHHLFLSGGGAYATRTIAGFLPGFAQGVFFVMAELAIPFLPLIWFVLQEKGYGSRYVR